MTEKILSLLLALLVLAAASSRQPLFAVVPAARAFAFDAAASPGCRGRRPRCRRRGALPPPPPPPPRMSSGGDRSESTVSAGSAEASAMGGAAEQLEAGRAAAAGGGASPASAPPPASGRAPGGRSSQQKGRRRRRRVAVLVCPAQFCVPSDYDDLVSRLLSGSVTVGGEGGEGASAPSPALVGAAAVAPLPRTEWIKVARQLPTAEFARGELSVPRTLDWYFDAIDRGVSDLLSQLRRSGNSGDDDEEDDVGLCLVGHSIGGWVARAYLGGMSRSPTAARAWALRRCTSLVTLGTPHRQADPGGNTPLPWLAVDQTRGLLRSIDEDPSCRAEALVEGRGIDVTCVCSDAVPGGLATPDQLVALASYLPLLGRPDPGARGDGIVPLDLAFMEAPARRVVLSRCESTSRAVRHSHVLPTPWNLWDGHAPSIRLPDGDFSSYVSPGVLSQWARYIR